MLKIGVKEFNNAGVHTITVGKRNFWEVRMYDIQEGLGIKNISDLVSKEIYGIFEIKNTTKDQIRKCKRPGREWFSDNIYIYVHNDLILKIIKNCRGSKK